MYVGMRKQRCDIRAREANQMCESHSQCVRNSSCALLQHRLMSLAAVRRTSYFLFPLLPFRGKHWTLKRGWMSKMFWWKTIQQNGYCTIKQVHLGYNRKLTKASMSFLFLVEMVLPNNKNFSFICLSTFLNKTRPNDQTGGGEREELRLITQQASMLKWEIICSQDRLAADALSQLAGQLLNCTARIWKCWAQQPWDWPSGWIIPDRGLPRYDDHD